MIVPSLRAWLASAATLSLAVASCGGSAASAPASRTSESAGAQPATSGAADPSVEGVATSGGATPGSNYVVSDVAIVPARTSDLPKPLPKPWIETPGFEQVLGKDWVAGYKVMLKVPNQPPGSYVQL